DELNGVHSLPPSPAVAVADPVPNSTQPLSNSGIKERLAHLDDPLHSYLRQIRHFPLLTAQEEVDIARRIENARAELHEIVFRFGFAAREHVALVEKVLWKSPRERFEHVFATDRIPDRNRHLMEVKTLASIVRLLDRQADRKFSLWQDAAAGTYR